MARQIPVGCVCCSFFFPKPATALHMPTHCPCQMHLWGAHPLPVSTFSSLLQCSLLPLGFQLNSAERWAAQTTPQTTPEDFGSPWSTTSSWSGLRQRGVWGCWQGCSLKLWVFLSRVKPLSGVWLLCKVVPPVMQMTNFYMFLFCSIYTAILDFLRHCWCASCKLCQLLAAFSSTEPTFLQLPFFCIVYLMKSLEDPQGLSAGSCPHTDHITAKAAGFSLQ